MKSYNLPIKIHGGGEFLDATMLHINLQLTK